jgi:hypothetical protein
MPLFSGVGIAAPSLMEPYMFAAKDSASHFLRRHEEETAAAEAAADRQARIAHLELAVRYALLAARDGRSSQNSGGTGGD